MQTAASQSHKELHLLLNKQSSLVHKANSKSGTKKIIKPIKLDPGHVKTPSMVFSTRSQPDLRQKSKPTDKWQGYGSGSTLISKTNNHEVHKLQL
jgi:hypothetical protein